MKAIPCVKEILKGRRNEFIYRALELIYLDTLFINVKCVYIMSVFFLQKDATIFFFLKKNKKEMTLILGKKDTVYIFETLMREDGLKILKLTVFTKG